MAGRGTREDVVAVDTEGISNHEEPWRTKTTRQIDSSTISLPRSRGPMAAAACVNAVTRTAQTEAQTPATGGDFIRVS